MLKTKIGRPHEERKIRKLLAKLEQLKAAEKQPSDDLKPAVMRIEPETTEA